MFQDSPGANPVEIPVEIKTGRYRKLAKAIRQGCEIAPRPCSTWFGAWGSACALGAAALAVDRTIEQVIVGQELELMELLENAFPELNDPCPNRPGVSICTAIILYNDGDGWSRENIAGWLESL